MGIGARLRTVRLLARKLSRRELAILADVAKAYPWLIESGDRENCGIETIAKLASVLGCTTDYLIRGVGEPDPDAVRAAVEAARMRFAEHKEAAADDPT